VQVAVERALARIDAAAKARQSQLGALGAERRAREEAEARARMLEADARITPERRALLAQAKAKREAEEKEKAETLRQIKEDAELRAHKARLQTQRASQSPGLPRNGGGGGGGGGGGNAAMRTFKDIGVDLNKPKSS
jgi:membrane protein involved in colicin uptake